MLESAASREGTTFHGLAIAQIGVGTVKAEPAHWERACVKSSLGCIRPAWCMTLTDAWCKRHIAGRWELKAGSVRRQGTGSQVKCSLPMVSWTTCILACIICAMFRCCISVTRISRQSDPEPRADSMRDGDADTLGPGSFSMVFEGKTCPVMCSQSSLARGSTDTYPCNVGSKLPCP